VENQGNNVPAPTSQRIQSGCCLFASRASRIELSVSAFDFGVADFHYRRLNMRDLFSAFDPTHPTAPWALTGGGFFCHLLRR
jgi:hypothetical protein